MKNFKNSYNNNILPPFYLSNNSFIKQFLGGPSEIDIEALKAENDELRRKVEDLEAELAQYKQVKYYLLFNINNFI